MTKLIAYDKKTKKYVDSITAYDRETITNFYNDFSKDCDVKEVA